MAHVLAVLNLAATAPAVLAAARLAAAALGGGGVEVLHVRHDPLEGFLPSEEVMTAAHRTALEGHEQERSAALRAAFEAWRGHGDVWREVAGPTRAVVIAAVEGTALAVMGHAPLRFYEDAWDAIEAALFAAGAAVLLVGEAVPTTLGRHVAVAWKPGEPARRALAAAMPLLERAERVDVLIARGYLPPEGLVGAEVVRVDEAEGSVGAALLAAVRERGADLLVMGAWSHRPLTEVLLGGVTRHVIGHAEVPVLLRH